MKIAILLLPLMTRKFRKGQRPWLTDDVILLIKSRDTLYHTWKRYRAPEHLLQNCMASKAVASKIRPDKCAFNSNKFKTAMNSKTLGST